MIKTLILIFLLISTNASSYASGYRWESNKNRVSIAQKIGENEKFLAQVFILDYAIGSKCVAFASVLSIANSKNLGKKTKEGIFKSNKKGNQLRFFIDDKEVKYQQEKIIKIEYENGVEFGTLSPPTLISFLKNSAGKIDIYLGETRLIRIPSSSDFEFRNKEALDYCLKHTK